MQIKDVLDINRYRMPQNRFLIFSLISRCSLNTVNTLDMHHWYQDYY